MMRCHLPLNMMIAFSIFNLTSTGGRRMAWMMKLWKLIVTKRCLFETWIVSVQVFVLAILPLTYQQFASASKADPYRRLHVPGKPLQTRQFLYSSFINSLDQAGMAVSAFGACFAIILKLRLLRSRRRSSHKWIHRQQQRLHLLLQQQSIFWGCRILGVWGQVLNFNVFTALNRPHFRFPQLAEITAPLRVVQKSLLDGPIDR